MENSMISPEIIKKWYQDKPRTTWGDLSGMAELKTRLRREIADILDPANPKPARSYFFYGLPATGKTMTMRAFARELMDAGYRYLCLSSTDVCSAYLGEAEMNVRAAFQEAMDSAPCVIAIDDIECVCPDCCKSGNSGYASRLRIAFLESLHMLLDSGRQVILLTASCHPQDADRAFVRQSRAIRFPLPDSEDRAAYLARELAYLHPEEGFSIQDMANATEGRSYRELNRLVSDIRQKMLHIIHHDLLIRHGEALQDEGSWERAARQAIADGQFPLNRAIFEEALARCPFGDKNRMLGQLQDFEQRSQP